MKLPDTAHTSRPWRIHELTPDFRLEDAWELPTPGGPDDFPKLVQGATSLDPSGGPPGVTQALWSIRWKLGELLGWDDEDSGLGSRVPTLRDRLPADLRDGPTGPDFDELPFKPLYMLDDEWAAEIANQTMHGVMHLGWVSDGDGGYRGQMAVLVKPNGLFGNAYMAAIRPFRHLVIYPPMIRAIGRRWRAEAGAPAPAHAQVMADAVRQVPVPNAALSHSTLDHVDYADAFVVETGAAQDHTAEEWARVILEGAPIAVKSALVSGWTALGLKLGSPTSTERVLGWEVRRSTRGLALLGAGARTGLSGELLVRRQRRAVAFSTFVQLDNPAARAMWAGIERGHQVVVRRMLEQAELAPGLARSGA